MWVLLDPGRLEKERADVNELEQQSPWLDGITWSLAEEGICIQCEIVVETQVYPVQLLFPQYYPSVPPSVRPRESARWSDHQYGDGGDLCLELGPDNWNPDIHNAADMLASAFKLLSLESEHERNPTVDIPSRHALTDGQQYRLSVFRLILTQAAKEALADLDTTQHSRCYVTQVIHEGSSTATFFVTSIELTDHENWCDPDLPSRLSYKGYRSHGIIIGQRQKNALTDLSSDPAILNGLLDQQPLPDPNDVTKIIGIEDITFVIVRDSQNRFRGYSRLSTGEKYYSCTTIEIDTAPGAIRHGLDADLLRNKTVAIVGLGSAGSKIATMLARSGVEHFVLIDDDLLHPCNLVRHESDWSQVGQHKVDAVIERLLMINPAIEIVDRKHRLGGQESATGAASALAAIGRADLIIDATANPRAFGLCARVARQSKTTLMWLEIYAGGIGGLVARAIPEKDTEPFSLREVIADAGTKIAEEKGVEPPLSGANYSAIDADDEVIIASDADVTTISGIATQMALDFLVEQEPSHFPFPAYFISMGRGWIFDQPLEVIPIEPTVTVGWAQQTVENEASKAAGIKFVLDMLKKPDDDANPSSAS